MIYEQIRKDKLKGKQRPLLSLLMSEICVDGKPMNDKDAVKTLVILQKNAQRTIEYLKEKGAIPGAHGVGYSDKTRALMEDEAFFIAMIDGYLPLSLPPNWILNMDLNFWTCQGQ